MTATESELRQWGMSLGLPIAARGRLPGGLVQRWNREHPDRPFTDTRPDPNRTQLKYGGEAADYRTRGKFTPERAAAAGAFGRRRAP